MVRLTNHERSTNVHPHQTSLSLFTIHYSPFLTAGLFPHKIDNSMDFLNENLPRRLSSRLWLITIPSGVVAFERRSNLPQLPAGPSRILGALFLAAGVGIGLMTAQRPETTIAYEGPLAPVARKPALLAGLVGLIGVAFLLRSVLLLAYTLAIAMAGGAERVSLEEPSSKTILSGD